MKVADIKLLPCNSFLQAFGVTALLLIVCSSKTIAQTTVEYNWQSILAFDQNTKIKKSNQQKEELLLQAYALFIQTGYPTATATAQTPLLTWIHCPDKILRWNTFAMIYQGYEQGSLSAEILNNYALRSIYFDLFFRYPLRVLNANQFTVDSAVNYLELSKVPNSIENLKKIKTPYDNLKNLINLEGCDTIGKYIRNFEPYYFRITTKKTPVVLLKCDNTYLYCEQTDGFLPQKMNLIPTQDENLLCLEFAVGASHIYQLDKNHDLTIISKKSGKVIYVFLKK